MRSSAHRADRLSAAVSASIVVVGLVTAWMVVQRLVTRNTLTIWMNDPALVDSAEVVSMDGDRRLVLTLWLMAVGVAGVLFLVWLRRLRVSQEERGLAPAPMVLIACWAACVAVVVFDRAASAGIDRTADLTSAVNVLGTDVASWALTLMAVALWGVSVRTYARHTLADIPTSPGVAAL